MQMISGPNSNNITPDASFNPIAHSSTSSFRALSSINHNSPESIRHRNKTLSTLVAKKVVDLSHDDIQLDVTDHYFKPDTVKETKEELKQRVKECRNEENFNAYETYFKPKVFLQFFTMHALFFFLLGPFIFILIPITGSHVLRNQLFLGWNRTVLNQSIQYLAIVGFLFAYYYSETKGLQAIEIYMLVTCVLIRLIIISSKYAYRSQRFTDLLFSSTLSPADLTGDLLLSDWRLQKDHVIEEEIQAAILRLEIDSSLFFFNFLGNPDAELVKKLKKQRHNPYHHIINVNNSPKLKPKMGTMDQSLRIIQDGEFSTVRKREVTETPKEQAILESTERTDRTEKTERPQPSYREKLQRARARILAASKKKEPRTKNAYEIAQSFAYYMESKKLEKNHLYGYNLAIDMYKAARDTRYKHLGKSLWIFSIVRALIPTFYRLYLVNIKNEDISVFTNRPYIIAGVFVINSFWFWINLFHLAVAILDFKSKIFCCKQLGYLISPKKITHFRDKKLYPTVNIFDPVTLKTWSSLRRVLNEYGKKYMLRSNFNVTITMMFYLVIVTIVVLQVLGVVNTYNDSLMMIVFAYESIIFFAVFISIMLAVAFINGQYMTDKSLLQKNKTIISDFQRLSYLYVGRDAIEPDNMVYKEGLRIMKAQLGEVNFEEKLISQAEKLTSMIDNIIEELEFEELHEPSTVMGIPVNYGLLKTIIAGLLSVIFAVGQSFAD